jgi:lambda repressor-like predicted transcriptional regulator
MPEMANEHLKNALRHAGLTVEQFAEIINVDPKTVQRWVAGRTPYPRHRQTVARALDLTEHELWPHDVPPPADPGLSDRPGTGEVTGSWGRSSAPGAPDPVALLADPVQRIDVLENDNGTLLLIPGLLDALHRRALDGCEVRVLTAAPLHELGPLIGQDGVELRIATAPPATASALIRAGDTMLLIIPLADPGLPPLLSLRRQNDEGIFDRLTHHFQTLWDTAATITSPTQLTEPQPAPHGPTNQPHDLESAGHARPQEKPATPTTEAPRRWPRRPG